MKFKPMGNRVLGLLEIEVDEVSKGGVLLPYGASSRRISCTVVEIGDGEEINELAKIGDKIIYTEGSGNRMVLDKKEYVIVAFEDILVVQNK